MEREKDMCVQGKGNNFREGKEKKNGRADAWRI